MRCFSCSKLSLEVLCKTCRETLLIPEVKRHKTGTLEVISFFKYTTLESLLHTKHKPEGYRIYKALAKMFLKPFVETFVQTDNREVYIIGIDEQVKSGYSHVALLTHAMRSRKTKPLHASLIAQNRVTYSGRSLQYRLDNPRHFVYRGKKGIDVILVDDIVTTGITLQEAQNVLLAHDVNVLFALTLAYVEEK